jgi:hypothetical protein
MVARNTIIQRLLHTVGINAGKRVLPIGSPMGNSLLPVRLVGADGK